MVNKCEFSFQGKKAVLTFFFLSPFSFSLVWLGYWWNPGQAGLF